MMVLLRKLVSRKLALLSAIVLSALIASGAVAAEVVAPDEVIKTTTSSLLQALKENKEKFEQDKDLVYGLLSDVILPNFDFVSMSKLALGKHWRKAKKEQRIEFVEQFRTLLVNTYAVALTHYSNQEVVVKPLRMKAGERRVTVKTEVNQPGGVSIPMYYRLLFKKEQWKVYDVVVDGVSLVTTYRSSFAQDMRKGGVDAVIGSLKKRNAKYQKVAQVDSVDEPTAEAGQ